MGVVLILFYFTAVFLVSQVSQGKEGFLSSAPKLNCQQALVDSDDEYLNSAWTKDILSTAIQALHRKDPKLLNPSVLGKIDHERTDRLAQQVIGIMERAFKAHGKIPYPEYRYFDVISGTGLMKHAERIFGKPWKEILVELGCN